ncbi:MAG: hypothetical protein NC311_09850 [Muribaculaceae bacterium]|nr:hypothetical protein [Muribaculaceae bacterium]
MNGRKRKTAITISLVIILAAAIAVSVYFIVSYFLDRNNGNVSDTVRTASVVESFDDVPSNFSLKLTSKENVTEKDVEVYDQNGNSVDWALKHEQDDVCRIVAPDGGWTSRGVYKIKLLNEDVEFADDSISDRRDVSFTVHGEEVCEIETNSEVVEIAAPDFGFFDVSESMNGEHVVDLPAGVELDKGSIIILPELDEMGFEVKTAYRVESVEDGKVKLGKPALEEVFDELDVLQSYDAELCEDYVKFAPHDEIEDQIADSEAVRRFARQSVSGESPKIKFDVKLNGNYVEFIFKVTFPKFLDDFDFVMQGSAKISFGVKANLSIIKGTYDLGAVISIKKEVKFSLLNEDKSGSKDIESKSAQRLQEMLNKNNKYSDLAVKLFNLYIPTPAPLLGFSFEVQAKFKLEAKVEIGITFADEITNSFGIKKTCDGVEPYNNKTVEKKTKEAELCGSVEAKLGFSIKFSGSLCGVIKAGVESEIGVYAKLAGFFKVQTVEKLSDPTYDDENFVGSGAYFEAGIYADLSAFAELKILWHTFKAKATIVEIRVPVISIGRTQMFNLKLNGDSVVLDESRRAAFPSIQVETTDMFTGKTEEKTVSGKDLTDKFIITAGKNIKFESEECMIYADEDTPPEFESIVTARLHVFESFLPKFEFTYGLGGAALSIKGKRGLIHLELGAINVSCNVTVTKKPIAVQELKISYERVEDDPEYELFHPELEKSEAKYRPRDDIGSVVDYQVGRLVKVVPTFTPLNASYKQLKYTVEKGAEFIVGGAGGIKTYTDGGATCAIFRLVDDTSAIGNVDGIIDPAKMIKLSATTIGYVGKYADMNVTDSTERGIVASAVPALSYGISPIIDGQSVKRTAVIAGESVPFGIDDASVYPKNATRGKAYESLRISSDYARLDSDNNIVIDPNAQVGSRIVVISEFSGIEREFFLNIVKNDVESISLTSNTSVAQPGTNIELEAHVTGAGGVTPTVSEVVYVVCAGSGKATVTKNLNNATLSIAADAEVGSIVRVFAVADGKRSNTVEIEVVKIAVQSVSLTTAHALTVLNGDSVKLDAEVMPKNASHSKAWYEITVGNDYAVIDKNSGVLSISNKCVGGESIAVTATADGVVSNVITFTVRSVAVRYVKFPVNYSVVCVGQTIALDAFVNPDATDKSILYTIVDGDAVSHIDGNDLVINSGLTSDEFITVRAECASDSGIFADKQFAVYSDKSSLSINGQLDTVYLVNGETATAVVTDENGDTVNNSDVIFSLTLAGHSTSYATVDVMGNVYVSSDIPEDEGLLEITLASAYNGKTHELYINVIIKPSVVILKTEDGSDTAFLHPNETIYLDIESEMQENAALYDDIEVEINGAINASIESFDEGFGITYYRLRVQAEPTAMTGAEAKVFINYKVFGRTLCKSKPFTITIARATESVEIANVPTALGIGKSAMLEAVGYPENTNYSPKYMFADSKSSNYAKLDANTGLLTVDYNPNIIGREIKVVAEIDTVFSATYVIEIDDEIRGVSIIPSSKSKGVQYVAELDSYFLYPDGEMDISFLVDGGGAEPNILIRTDIVGEMYLDITDNIVTVKRTNVNHGINATIVAYADNGVVSDPIIVYIPAAISSVQDFMNIANNISGYYVLTCDIDFDSEVITPIPMFAGILDGNGHALKNLKFDSFGDNGRFGLITENRGMIFNLNIIGVTVNISSATYIDKPLYGGVLCAENYGYIINCKVTSPLFKFIYLSVWSHKTYVAGICGYNDGGIRDCYVSLYISSAGYAAGVVGKNDINGSVSDCVNGNDIYYGAINNEVCVTGVIAVNSGMSQNNMNYGEYKISGLANNLTEVK